MKSASQILAENILHLFEETSKSANEVSQASGVGQTTISAWLRKAREADPTFNPRLDQLDAVARQFGRSVADLFCEDLVRTNSVDISPKIAVRPAQTIAASPKATSILQRLVELEQAGSSSPALYDAIEKVIDLAQPKASRTGYDGLDGLPAE